MMKINQTNGYWLARAGTAGMLILGVILMGCDKDSKLQNQNTSAEQAMDPPAITPAPSAPPSAFVTTPPDKKSDRDWSQPYQLIPIGDAIIKIPTGYILMLDHGEGNSKGKKENVILQASIVLAKDGKPRFLTTNEAMKAGPFNTYNMVLVYVNKDRFDFKKGRSLFEEQGALRNSLVGQLNPPVVMEDLGLKRYTEALGAPRPVYFPLDPKFRMPNGEIFYMSCDQVPPDPKTYASCKVVFVPRNRVLVDYSFPPQYLRHWKEIHQFVLNTLQFSN